MSKPRFDNETNDQKFKRIAAMRTNAILDKIRLLGNLSNKRIYKYSDEDVEKIFTAINRQVKETKSKFFGVSKQRFKL